MFDDSSISLIECVNNFLEWSGASVAEALRAVTATPADMMGVSGVKGTMDCGADADFVILSESKKENGSSCLAVDAVWKFGTEVFNGGDGK